MLLKGVVGAKVLSRAFLGSRRVPPRAAAPRYGQIQLPGDRASGGPLLPNLRSAGSQLAGGIQTPQRLTSLGGKKGGEGEGREEEEYFNLEDVV